MPASYVDESLQALATAFHSVVDSFSSFSLKDLGDDFPYSEYLTNTERYEQAVSWFTGKVLEPKDNSQKTELYPIRINPIQGTVLKHGYALFGESNNDGRPLVVPRMIKDEPKKQRKAALHAEKFFNKIWWESFGRTMMLENGITSQIFGGCVFNIRYVPWETWRKIPFRIERVNPDCFIGVPIYGDEYRLQESWIIKNISPRSAKFYGVDVTDKQTGYWVEHWEQDKYKITINGKLIQWSSGGKTFKGEGENICPGVIPMVYIPHIRAGNFYGMNNIDHLKGIVKEINLRFADFGDAVNVDSHVTVAMKNVQGTPRMVKITEDLEVLDLGAASGITGNEPEPDIMEVRKGTASSPMREILTELYNQYRRDASHPAVADGEDEGSQRSAATLVARMWPLTSHINMERINWTGGLDWLSQMLLMMAKAKKVGEIDDSHLDMRIRQEWPSILPKDREQLANELVNRSSQNLGAPTHLLEMFGDVEDPEQELNDIKDFMQFKANLKRTSTGADETDPTAEGGDGDQVEKNLDGSNKQKEVDGKQAAAKEKGDPQTKKDVPNSEQ